MLRTEKAADFNPANPKWLHKENFFSAFSEGEKLAALITKFKDETGVLSIETRQGSKVEGNLMEPDGIQKLESFLSSEVFRGAGLQLVAAELKSGKHSHQFGNTKSGVRKNNDTRTIHIINLQTVREVSKAIGKEIDPLRFRANIIVDGLPAWSEFEWVDGDPIQFGEAHLLSISRTVRCEGISTDLQSAQHDMDLPALLNQHFPEHGPYLGVYAQVVKAGQICVSDTVIIP